MPKSEKAFIKHSLTTFLTQAMFSLASLFCSLIIARQLGPHGKGVVTLFLLAPLLALTFGRMGIGHASNYYAVRYPENVLVTTSMAVSICLGIVSGMLTYFIFHIWGAHWQIESPTQIWISLIIPIYFTYDCAVSLLQGQYRINQRNLVVGAQPLVNLGILAYFALFSYVDEWRALTAWNCSIILTTILALWSMFRLRPTDKLQIDYSLLRKLVLFGWKAHWGNVFKTLNYRLDALILGYLTDASVVGLYSAAVSVAETVLKIPDAIGTVLLPKIVNMNNAEAKTFTPLVCRVMLMFIIIVSGLLFCAGDFIITMLFGKAFLPAVLALYLLVPGIIFLSVWKVLSTDVIARGLPLQFSISSFVSLIVMIALDFVLIPVSGIKGASLASSISYFAALGIIIFYYKNINRITIKDIMIPQWTDFQLLFGLLRSKFPMISGR